MLVPVGNCCLLPSKGKPYCFVEQSIRSPTHGHQGGLDVHAHAHNTPDEHRLFVITCRLEAALSILLQASDNEGHQPLRLLRALLHHPRAGLGPAAAGEHITIHCPCLQDPLFIPLGRQTTRMKWNIDIGLSWITDSLSYNACRAYSPRLRPPRRCARPSATTTSV